VEEEVEIVEEGVEIMEEIVEIFEDDSEEPCQIILKRQTPSKYRLMGEWRVLDLGCGSGLCGKVFQDFFISKSKIDDRNREIHIDVKDKKDLNIEESTIDSNKDNDVIKIDNYGLNILKEARCQPGGFMMGIDISIKMVEIAEKSGFYTSVAKGDLLESLEIFEHFENTHTHNSSSVCHNNMSQSTNIDQNNDIKNNDNNNNNNNDNNNSNDNNDNNGITDIRDLDDFNKDMKLDLVLVADTFIYVGGLSNVFKQVKQSLNKYGLFAFSIEDLDRSPMKIKMKNLTNNCINISQNSINVNEIVLNEDNEPLGSVPGWGTQLLTSARFAHSNSYIEILANLYGFIILNMKIVILRTEDTVPLYGRLYVLQII